MSFLYLKVFSWTYISQLAKTVQRQALRVRHKAARRFLFRKHGEAGLMFLGAVTGREESGEGALSWIWVSPHLPAPATCALWLSRPRPSPSVLTLSSLSLYLVCYTQFIILHRLSSHTSFSVRTRLQANGHARLAANT